MDNLDFNSNSSGQSAKPKPRASAAATAARMAKAGNERGRLVRNRVNSLLNGYFHIFTIIAVIVILFIGYRYLLLPKYREVVKKIETNNTEKQKLLSEKKKELENLEKVVNVYRELSQDNVKKFSDLIPVQYPKEDLFTEIVYLVSKNGFTVNSVVVSNTNDSQGQATATPTATPAAANTARRRTETVVSTSTTPAAPQIPLPPGVSRMYIKLDIGGLDYAGLRRLLSVFENNLRLLDISDLEYDPISRTAKMSLQTYYFAVTNK